MGPLITQGIINPEWNFVIALIIGIAFGYILEASGFSSSRKIAGVFYGYDFTVLRVFMTAVMVAMVGLVYFNYMGWIDLSLIFVLPTYISSVLVGGTLMGLGFVMGGYCPGTSFTGIAIGKLDALVFTGGLFLGIFIFSEIFPWVETILKPQKPSEAAPSEEFALYDFRLGACQYFGGGSVSVESDIVAEPVPQIRKKKKTVVEGGC